jgi:hypothetical protein
LSDYIGTEPLQMSERHFRRANEAFQVLFCSSFPILGASMEITDLENMNEAEIIDAVSKAVLKVFEDCDAAKWGGLFELAMVNYPNLTDKQKILRDALSREGRHGRIINVVERTTGRYCPHAGRPCGG